MRRALVVLLTALVACREPAPTRRPPSPVDPAGTPPVTAHTVTSTMHPKLFERDQPTTAGVLPWDGSLVVRSSPLQRIDLTRGAATPLTEGGAEVLDVATYGDTPVALVRGTPAPRLFAKEAGKLREIPLPALAPPAKDHGPVVRLAASKGVLVLWEPGRVHRYDGRSWRSVTIVPDAGPKRGPPAASSPRHFLVFEERLYLGSDAGEWGGRLVSVDLATGQTRAEDPSLDAPERQAPVDLPVHALAVTGATLWVARGLAHLGFHDGYLHRWRGGRWELVAMCERGFGEKPDVKGGDWSLPATSFAGLAFDTEGRVLLATEALGLVRRDAGGWTRLTDGWPEHVYLSGLTAVGTTAAIATYDAGVLLIDTKTGAIRRVPLAPRRTAAVAPSDPQYFLQEHPDKENRCKRDEDCVVGGCANYACTADPNVFDPCKDTPALPPENAVCGCVAATCMWWR